jgi:hypothetical protein
MSAGPVEAASTICRLLSEAVRTPAVEMSPVASVRTTTASCVGSASMAPS